MAEKNSAAVMVRLAPDTVEELKEISDREERTVAQTIRLAVKRFLQAEQSSRTPAI